MTTMKKLANLLTLALILAAPTGANAILPMVSSTYAFNFEQGGFPEGAMASGMFSGEDFDTDGRLNFDMGEITSFMLSYSGSSSIPAFTMDLGDLNGLNFLLSGGNVLGDDDGEELFGNNGLFFFEAFETTEVIDPSGGAAGIFDRSSEPMIVTPKDRSVPDAGSTVAFLAIGLLALAGSKRNGR